jgi:hypothetical protein
MINKNIMARTINTNKKIISATLKLAETITWQKITMEEIAKAAKVEPSILLQNFSSKLSILDAFNCHLDAEITQEFAKTKKWGSAREQLFDIIMTRFDSLNSYKRALRLIYKTTVPYDLRASICGLNNVTNSMKIVLDISNISTITPLGCIRTKLLSAIFLRSFVTWLNDDSADMAKTMAKLDSDLAKAEKLSNLIANTN